MATALQLQRVHDLVTLDRLVALVDRRLSLSSRVDHDDPLARIQLDATLDRAQELVDSLSSSSPHPAPSSSARPPHLDQLAARLARAHARAAALPRPSPDHLAADEPAAPAPLAALLDALGPVKPITPLDALPWSPAASTSALPPTPTSADDDADAPPPLSGAATAPGKSERSALAALTPPAPASASLSISSGAAAPSDPASAPSLAPAGSRLRARRPAPTSSSRPTSTTSAATSADEADLPTPSSSATSSPTRRTLAPGAATAATGDDKPIPPYLAAKRARAREKALRAAADEDAAREAAERAVEREREEREERERREREEREAGRGRLGLRLRGRGAKGKGKEKEKAGEGEGEKGALSARDELLPVGSSTAGAGADLASYHASEQASLLGALSSLSSTLKASTLEFSTLLERDKEVLAAAEGKLEGSEGQMSKEGKRLEGVRKKGKGTTCATLGILAVVAVLWVLVFLLIKVT
ncbi:hypothetical protein JCM9279_000473 [Rhodotorula babjevae]